MVCSVVTESSLRRARLHLGARGRRRERGEREEGEEEDREAARRAGAARLGGRRRARHGDRAGDVWRIWRWHRARLFLFNVPDPLRSPDYLGCHLASRDLLAGACTPRSRKRDDAAAADDDDARLRILRRNARDEGGRRRRRRRRAASRPPLSYRRGSHAGDDNTYADVATSSRRGSPRARRLSTPSIAMAPFRNPFEEMKKANEIKRAKKEKGVKDGPRDARRQGEGAFSLHWSPYDRVGVVNAVP